jgi:hypothetical protein
MRLGDDAHLLVAGPGYLEPVRDFAEVSVQIGNGPRAVVKACQGGQKPRVDPRCGRRHDVRVAPEFRPMCVFSVPTTLQQSVAKSEGAVAF